MESVYEKGVLLDEALKSALQDTSDCPELSSDCAVRVEAMVGLWRPIRRGRALKIAASIAACVTLAGLVFAAAVGVVSWRNVSDESDSVDGNEPIPGSHVSSLSLSSPSAKGETEMNIKRKTVSVLAAAALAATPMTAGEALADATPSTLANGEVVYENDFSVRRSAGAPGTAWSVYNYDKGGPVAYDYAATPSFNYLTGVYPWQGGSIAYSQQDGWIKADSGKTTQAWLNRNRGRSSVSDEDDPALVFSDIDQNTNHEIEVFHTFRNVFTNGVVKMQFDIRQVGGYVSSKLHSWLRLRYDKDLMNMSSTANRFPIELGCDAGRLSGAWRNDGDEDGKRTWKNLTNVAGLHWFRCYMTCDLDTKLAAFEVYDLGTSRIDMDSSPSGEPISAMSDLLFCKNPDDTTGGVSGYAITVACCDTQGRYGEEGFNEDYAYKYDNIKASWKAPSASDYIDFYRNDFSRSKRRTVDGNATTDHVYETADATESSTFTYRDELVRDFAVGTQTGTPYLPAVFGDGNTVQNVGVDGWRFGGASSYSGSIALTTNGSNRVGMLTKNAMVLQTMCPDVTNGMAKFEYDFRMPIGWNGNYGDCYLILVSQRGYREVYNFANLSLLSVGPCSTDGKANSSSPVTTYSIVNSGKYSLAPTRYANSDSKFKALEWYRVQLFIDLDASTYSFCVYDLGSSSPTSPGSFDSSDTNNAIYASGPNNFFQSKKENTATDPKYYGKAIGAYGFVAWNNPSADTDYAILVDNVRFWKGDGENWDLVFQNDFSSSQRIGFTRRSLNLIPSGRIDRPEHGEDGWASVPTYTNSVNIVGENPALDAGCNHVGVVHPLGFTFKRGKMFAQYDVRIPTIWNSRMDYFWLELGGGAMASASTWKANAYRYQTRPTIRTGIQGKKSGNAIVSGPSGAWNNTAAIAISGNGAGTITSTKATYVNHNYVGHWIRMRVEADMRAKKWACKVFDMGTGHPTADTVDGTQLYAWENLGFLFNDPITHLLVLTGRAPSYAPWQGDLPGALLLDNIRVIHRDFGSAIIIR